MIVNIIAFLIICYALVSMMYEDYKIAKETRILFADKCIFCQEPILYKKQQTFIKKVCLSCFEKKWEEDKKYYAQLFIRRGLRYFECTKHNFIYEENLTLGERCPQCYKEQIMTILLAHNEKLKASKICVKSQAALK